MKIRMVSLISLLPAPVTGVTAVARKATIMCKERLLLNGCLLLGSASMPDSIFPRALCSRLLSSKIALGILVSLVMVGTVMPLPAFGLSIVASSFDQVAMIKALGGSVTQIGGGQPGKSLNSAADFVGPVNTQSGVSVTLPGYQFTSSFSNFNPGSSVEPGNVANLLLGAPTDITFTTPGANGPDGTPGDGSVQLKVPGAFVTLRFAGPITAPAGVVNDLFFFTDTAGGGNTKFEILSPTNSVLESLNTSAPLGAAGSGRGGLILNVTDGFTYSAVRLTVLTGSAEFDAVAATVPEPATLLLLGSGLVGLAGWRRRRRHVIE